MVWTPLLQRLPWRRRRPEPQGPHARLKVALVADELTRSSLLHECRVVDLIPADAHRALRAERPDLLFVESAWQGFGNAWKYRIAAYPDHPERNNAALAQLVAEARELGIPAVFWNKEDGVHFERFIDSARLFDRIYTVDADCVPRYRQAFGDDAQVGVLAFAVQPALHGFRGIDPARRSASFVGSYSRHIHDTRRARQDMLLGTAGAALGVTVYDRNSDRRGGHYRYPALPGLTVKAKVAYAETADVYRKHLVSLNVNTVVDSPTMFSRRLVEILACGGLAVSTPALAIERLFKDLCHVVDSADEADALFGRLARDGYSARDREMMQGGAEHVLANHTWSQRIGSVLDAIAGR